MRPRGLGYRYLDEDLEKIRLYKIRSWNCKCCKCKAVLAKYKKHLKTKT